MNNQKKPIAIAWFRQDLRLNDNPALNYAHQLNYQILPIYILDNEASKQWKMGGASRWWLHQSLKSLNQDLVGKLCFAQGDSLSILKNLIQEKKIKAIYWNHCYEPDIIKRDSLIKQIFKASNLDIKRFNASLLFKPNQVLKEDGTPYKVFTPFYKKGYLREQNNPRIPINQAKQINLYDHKIISLDDLGLMPKINWHHRMKQSW